MEKWERKIWSKEKLEIMKEDIRVLTGLEPVDLDPVCI